MAIVASGQISLIDLNDSKQLQLFIGSDQPKTQIYNPNNGSYTPNWSSVKPTLTPQLFLAGDNSDIISGAKSVKWYLGGTTEITGAEASYTISGNNLIINSNILSNKNSQLFVCEVVYTDPDTNFDITTKADFEFVKVTNGEKGDKGDDGVNAIMAVLSNDSHTVPTDSDGKNGNYTGATSTIEIFEGATDVTSSWTVTQTRSNVTVSESTSSKTATVTNMSADSGYVEFKATRSGYASITKRFSLTKNKQGIKGDTGSDGQNATAYWLVGSASAIQKDIDNNLTPSTITFTAKSQTGTSSPQDYAGRWIIATSTDGDTFSDKYTSSSNESSKSYSPSSNVKAIRARLYRAGGTSTLIDEQIIPVVSDGKTGAKGDDAVVAVVWTPNGNTLKNSEGNITATIDVYKGSSEVSPSAFKWYIQNPSANGDTDSGAGWERLTSTTNYGVTGYTTDTINIPASAIVNVESFMCIATYNGNKYRDVATAVDVTDPIVVTVVGLNTFKNGQGSTEMTAKLYRNGDEIDTGGTEYSYSWSLYNSDNSKVSGFSKTGKTITVSASSVNARANLVCEVSPK